MPVASLGAAAAAASHFTNSRRRYSYTLKAAPGVLLSKSVVIK